jgi:hypothetical protein
VKYEIENFKKKPVRLDVVENLRHLRSEVRPDSTGRDVQWELGKETTFKGWPRRGAERRGEACTFHAELPAAATDGKAEKIGAQAPRHAEERMVKAPRLQMGSLFAPLDWSLKRPVRTHAKRST